MSRISAAIKLALGTLASHTDEVLVYRVNEAGAWLPLASSFLLPGPVMQIGYDEKRGAIFGPMTARLKVPTDGPHLKAGSAGVRGAEVKDQSGTIWAVIGPAHSVGQSIYLLSRSTHTSQGDARGSTP